jgi:hypothetical protein
LAPVMEMAEWLESSGVLDGVDAAMQMPGNWFKYKGKDRRMWADCFLSLFIVSSLLQVSRHTKA